MRTKLGVLAIGCLCLPFFQCGGGDDATGAQVTDAGSGDATTTDGAPPINDSGPVDSGPPIVTVNGTLMGRASDGGPLASRDVVVVDANGVVMKVVSDANGLFHAPNVQTPYDIGVPYVPLDAAAPASPFYYAGISRVDPIVRGLDYNSGPGATGSPQTTTLSFTTNQCNGCQIFYSGPDSNGGASGTGSSQLYTVAYDWTGSATHSVPLHIYVTDHTGVFLSYVDIPSTALVAGGTTALGTPTFSSVSNGTLALTVTLAGGYAISDIASTMTNSDGSRVADFNLGTGLTATANYPKIPGLAIALDIEGYGPNPAATTTGAITYSEATTPATLMMNLPAAPTLLTPADHATGVASAQSLTWSVYANPTVYQLLLTSAGGSQYIIYSGSPNLDLSQLAKADMPVASGTTYSWRVAGGGYDATMDQLVTTQAPTTGIAFIESGSLTQTFTTQ